MLTSAGYGVLSAILPVINAEAYVVAAQVSAVGGLAPVVVGIGIGQTIGKVLLFQAVRQGRESRFARSHQQRPRTRPKGRFRLWWDAFLAKLLDLVGDPRWGLPIVLLAAVLGLPPLFAVALLAGATTMNTGWFALLVLVGRIIRFALVGLGATGVLGIFA